jgi:hypothetical protein
MKGKTILACTSQNRILSYNHQDLKQKNCYNCPNKQLIGILCLKTNKNIFNY